MLINTNICIIIIIKTTRYNKGNISDAKKVEYMFLVKDGI